ncbi:MAG: mechanosensitive ion channel family protein [Aureispira sp.]|nr:mechanosensitive ion channel family protein [Aureispira sp.]
MNLLKYILIIVVLLLPLLGAAQEVDSTVVETETSVKDSVLNAQLEEMMSMLEQADSLHRVDSMRIARILVDLEKLKTTDNIKKQSLLQELHNIQSADSLQRAIHKQRIESLRSISKGFPVNPFRDTLFYIYNKIGSFSPSERAQNITQRIGKLEADDFTVVDSIVLQQSINNITMDIVYNELIILSITEDDALWMNSSKEVLAAEYLEAIKEAILVSKKEHSWENLLIRIGISILIIIGMIILTYLIRKLFTKAKNSLVNYKKTWIKGITIRGYQLLTPDRQVDFLQSILGFIQLIVILIALYITLPLIFSVFPWTKGIAHTLFDGLLNPTKQILWAIVNYIPNLLTIAVIYGFFHYTIRFFAFLAKEIELEVLKIPGFYPDWAETTFGLIRFLLYVFMFILIFPYLPGSDSPIFQGVSVFLGVLFSLGSSSAIANIVSGLVITYMRPFQEGDRIKIGDQIGDVIEKSMLVTRLRTIKNEYITVPNSTILSGKTTNYSVSAKTWGLILHTKVTIGYDVPWQTVHELLVNAALAVDGIEQDRRPFVLQTSLDDNYVEYELNAYTNTEKTFVMYSEINKNIQNQFNAAGIDILSPTYESTYDGDSYVESLKAKTKKEDSPPPPNQ